MPTTFNWTAGLVFIGFFALVTVLGFVAARWKAGDMTQLHEWGLGGRQFGTVISWFLVGGDFYTAYTVIAVPALVYAVGAYGFFALPYTIIVYPFVFAVMPKLWTACNKGNHITAADFVQGLYGGRWFAAAIALTGIVATMPYIALQLVGMQVVIKSLGVTGEAPLVIAFLILAVYTYASGLRAPAMIAFVKDIMIYIVVIAAIWLIPSKLGALVFIIVLPTKFAIDLQLLGGVWILQTFPAVVFSLYTRWLKLPALFIGWAAGIGLGTTLAFMQDLKPIYVLHLGDASYPMYIGLIALALNIVLTLVLSVVLPARPALAAR